MSECLHNGMEYFPKSMLYARKYNFRSSSSKTGKMVSGNNQKKLIGNPIVNTQRALKTWNAL